MGIKPLLTSIVCILITQLNAYTYTAGTFPTVLPCTWQCLTGSPTGSCFCVVNMNITAKWSQAQSVCTADGAYLAKILNADEQMLMEELTLRYAWNTIGTNATTIGSKNLYIGLQRNYYYSGTSQPIFKWRDTCLEPKTDYPTLSQIYNGYTTTLWTNIPATKPEFPIGCCNDGIDLGQLWFSTDVTLGPWNDYPYEVNYIGQYIGAYCRKDTNICGSNPCKNGGVCVDTHNSCFTCTCAAGFRGTTCEYSIVPSTLTCDWTCLNDAVQSCICVIRNDSSTLTWSDAKAICEADGAYLARIDTKAINDVVDYEVRLKVGPNNFGGTGPFNLNYQQTAAFGLQRLCNGTALYYQWKDNCLERKVYLASDFTNVLTGSTLYPTGRFAATTTMPIGAAQDYSCTPEAFYYETYAPWGPWDDWYCCGTFYLPANLGIVCRKDLNPCGSNPCLATQDCVANKSCFNCVPKTTSTTTSTTTTTTTTTPTTTTTTPTTTTTTTPPTTTTVTLAPGVTTATTTTTSKTTTTTTPAATTTVAGATAPPTTTTTSKTTTTTSKVPTTTTTTTKLHTTTTTAAIAIPATVAPTKGPIIVPQQQAQQIFCPFISNDYPNLITTSNTLTLTNNNYPTGTLLTFKCDKGYNRVGVYSIKCNTTGWSDIPPQCIKPQWKWWWWPWLLAMLLALAACLFCILYYLLFKRAKDRQRQLQYPTQHWAPPRIVG